MTKHKYEVIYISNDHTGIELKTKIISYLKKEYKIIDLGTNDSNSVDYPDYGISLSEKVAQTPNALGIAICGSGNGINISCNKVDSIRSALLYNKKSAIYAKKHNNANVIVFSARFISNFKNIRLLKYFLNSEFESGRHENRIKKIHQYETNRK